MLFDVISEKGPPHMRTFVTKCSVGDSFETMGEGNGKKVSYRQVMLVIYFFVPERMC